LRQRPGSAQLPAGGAGGRVRRRRAGHRRGPDRRGRRRREPAGTRRGGPATVRRSRPTSRRSLTVPVLEVVGWLGSAVLVLSLAQTRVMRFRVLNAASCAVLVGYNAAIAVWPMAAVNVVLLV